MKTFSKLSSFLFIITLLTCSGFVFAIEGPASDSNEILLEAPIQKNISEQEEVISSKITEDEIVFISGFVTEFIGNQISVISTREKEINTFSLSEATSVTSFDTAKVKTLNKTPNTNQVVKKVEPQISVGDFVSIRGVKDENGIVSLKKIIIMHDGSKLPSQFIK